MSRFESRRSGRRSGRPGSGPGPVHLLALLRFFWSTCSIGDGAREIESYKFHRFELAATAERVRFDR